MISLIIPALNERENLQKLIPYLKEAASRPENLEIIVVEVQTEENIEQNNTIAGVKYVYSKVPQRGVQMNIGAQASHGEILYFLHADSIPPLNFDEMISESIQVDKSNFGCFRMMFDSKNYLLSFYSYFTRFRHDIFHGGDASLFVSRTLFDNVEGYDKTMKLMEDYDIIRRLKKVGKFVVLCKKITTSAKKYKEYGMIRLQWIYFVIQMMFRLNVSQERMIKYYRRKVK